ncbi:MAG: amidohydrolase [Pseudomonadota bacterium]
MLDAPHLANLIDLRHRFHANPELGFEEVETAAQVADRLRAAGWDVATGIGGTGVVGTLRRGDGPSILLRADMDALAMPEVATPPYASRHPGRMHACGHDGHMVMLLGAAEVLAQSGGFAGTVHAVFQPAEEGRGGAKAMIEDGLLDRFPAEMAFGLHNMPGLATDEIAVVEGPQLASSDSWLCTFQGTGTHGAKPHLGRDPITAAATFLSQMQSIPGREVDPLEPAVLSACALEAGDFDALNVIPDAVRIGGTARAYSAAVRTQLETALERLAKGIAKAHGLDAEYRFIRRIPPVVNAAAPVEIARQAARSVGRLRPTFPPSTAGDDFAEFSERMPGCYAWIGNGPAVDGALHHNGRYDFADAAILTGVAYWVALVRAALPLA